MWTRTPMCCEFSKWIFWIETYTFWTVILSAYKFWHLNSDRFHFFHDIQAKYAYYYIYSSIKLNCIPKSFISNKVPRNHSFSFTFLLLRPKETHSFQNKIDLPALILCVVVRPDLWKYKSWVGFSNKKDSTLLLNKNEIFGSTVFICLEFENEPSNTKWSETQLSNRAVLMWIVRLLINSR